MLKWFVLFIFSLPIQLSAQEGFNDLFNFELNATVMSGMVLDNDTIVVAGIGVADTSNNQLFYIAKLDTLGNLLDIFTKYNEIGNHYYFWKKSSLIKTSDGGYAACGTSSNDLSVFVKFSHNLDLDFIKEFDLEDSNVTFYRNLVEIENGYIIVGDMQKFDFDESAFAQKLDLEGNEVWYKTYDEPNIPELNTSICQLYNDDVLVGMLIDNSSLVTISIEDGNIVWAESSENSTINDVLYPTIDTGFIKGTYVSNNIPIPQEYISNLTVIKYDKNKEIEWEKTYEDSLHLPRGFTDITSTPDGHYIGVAYGVIFGYGYTTLVWKFDANTGEEIWKYIFPEEIHTPGHNLYDAFLRSVAVLPNGSVICAGDVKEGNPDGGQKAWIMKLDPQGCYTQDSCATMIVGIDDIISQNLLQPKVISYPDPATDYIQFKTDSGLTHPNEKYTTHIYDVSGKSIHKSTSSDYLDDIRISVSPFESGVYFYTLHGDKGDVFTGKFVKK